MWKVEYSDILGRRIVHTESFHTRKAARLWCKKVQKPAMVLHGPQEQVERFQYGERHARSY